jgi:hypothetical protein
VVAPGAAARVGRAAAPGAKAAGKQAVHRPVRTESSSGVVGGGRGWRCSDKPPPPKQEAPARPEGRIWGPVFGAMPGVALKR